jgi:hypothetical protein
MYGIMPLLPGAGMQDLQAIVVLLVIMEFTAIYIYHKQERILAIIPFGIFIMPR